MNCLGHLHNKLWETAAILFPCFLLSVSVVYLSIRHLHRQAANNCSCILCKSLSCFGIQVYKLRIFIQIVYDEAAVVKTSLDFKYFPNILDLYSNVSARRIVVGLAASMLVVTGSNPTIRCGISRREELTQALLLSKPREMNLSMRKTLICLAVLPFYKDGMYNLCFIPL